MDLKDFQIEAIADLNAAMERTDARDIVLKSPTGSGKTIILTCFMSDYMRDHANVVFVWLTPGKGELEEQSKAKMDRYCHNASTKNLADVMTGGFAAGDAVFINWEKLTKKGSNALKDSERTNFTEWIEKALNAGVAFKVVVDESHQGDTPKANAIVELFKTDKIIRASATPHPDRHALMVEVREEEVIASGLIKKMIEINPDFPRQVAFAAGESETGYLLDKAMTKRAELRARFLSRGVKVNPLVVVQLPNKDEALAEEVEAWFAAREITTEAGTLAVRLTERHDNLDGIEEREAKPVAIIIKLAVATGWDCPRAQILVKLRRNMDETFEIQTIGRIRRMPEAKHYADDALDHCYLYTLDEKFTAGVRQSLGKGALDARKLFVRSERKTVALVKEQRTMVAETRDPAAALKATGEWLKRRYKLGADFEANQKKLAAAGYVFREEIWRRTQSGTATVLGDISGGGLDTVEVATAISTHIHGRSFHHAVAEIGAACALRYDDVQPVVFALFGAGAASAAKRIALDARRLYAFVINNVEKLKADFREALAAELPLTVTGNPVAEKEFRFPQEWVCTYDGTLKGQTVGTKNIYKDYPMSSRPRSTGEVKFEKWCEGNAGVEWWYRNGDKGDEYFSVVYTDNANRQRLFYPDYILKRDGEIWIIEIKGGFDGASQSDNIDIYAAKKASALKAYCAKHSLRGGFVCHSAAEDSLLLFEGGFSEDENDPGWKLLV